MTGAASRTPRLAVPSLRSRGWRIALVAAKLAVFAACVWWLATRSDPEAVMRRLKDIDAATLVTVNALALLSIAILALRLRWIVERLKHKLGYGEALRLTFICIFFNQILPSGIGGDGMRILGLTRHGVGAGRAFVSVLADRIAGLAVLLLVLLPALPTLSALDHGKTTAAVIAAVVAAMWAGLFLLRFTPAVLWLARLPALGFLRHADQAARNILTGAGDWLWLIAVSLPVQLIPCLMVWLLARDLGADASFAAATVSVLLALMAGVLPITIGSWGVRESILAGVLTAQGSNADAALAVTLGYASTLLVSAGIGGFVWLVGRRPASRPSASG